LKQGTRSIEKSNIASNLGSIYAFMFSLMVSGVLLGAPVIGGAIYICGRLGVSFWSAHVRKATALMTKKQWFFNMAVYFLLLIINLTLLFVYPYDVPARNVWTLFFILLFLTVSDAILKTTHLPDGVIPIRSLPKSFLISQILLAAAGTVVLMLYFPVYFYMPGSYLIAFTLQFYERFSRRKQSATDDPSQLLNARSAFMKGNVYRLYETTCILITMAGYISTILVYCSLALTTEQLMISMAIAFVANLLFAEAAEYMIRLRSHKKVLSPDVMIIYALVMWLAGLMLYCRNILLVSRDITYVYFGMGLCSAGISVSAKCLGEMDRIVRQAVRLNAEAEAAKYTDLSFFRDETVEAVSEMAALLILTLFTAFHRGIFRDGQVFITRLQPYLLLPASLLIIAALLTMLRYPVSNFYAGKLTRLLGLIASGGSNEALSEQVESIFVRQRKRPLGTNILKVLFRPFCRHKLVGWENVKEDLENPIVFLCNHASVYGPLTAVVNLPIPVRPWVISNIVTSKEEFYDYFMENTLGPSKVIPERLKPCLCRLLGRLSVWCMTQLDSIPVYRLKPSQLRQTFRLSSDALQSGDNLLIFPEDPAKAEDGCYPLEGVGSLYEGFTLLATVYHRRTGKRCRFIPMFAHKETKSIYFGHEILFDPEANDSEERARICREAEEQLQALYETARGKKN